MYLPRWLSVTLLGLAWPGPAHAQRLVPGYLHGSLTARPGAEQTPQRPPSTDEASMVVAGLLLGTVGFFGGGYTGLTLGGGTQTCGDDPCGLAGAVWGAAAGVSIAIPLGVHLANHSRGNYGVELVTSLAIGAAGTALALSANNGAVLLAVPLAQLIASIAIERRHTAP